MLSQYAEARCSLGPGRPDVVLGECLDGRRAHIAAEQGAQRGPLRSFGRQHPPCYGESRDQQQREPVTGHRIENEGHHGADVIDRFVPADRLPDSQRNRDQYGQHQCNPDDESVLGELGSDNLAYRLIQLVRVAQVAAQELAEIVEVLHKYWMVQSVLCDEGADLLSRSLGPNDCPRQLGTGRNQVLQDERDQRDAQDHDQCLQQAPDHEATHKNYLPARAEAALVRALAEAPRRAAGVTEVVDSRTTRLVSSSSVCGGEASPASLASNRLAAVAPMSYAGWATTVTRGRTMRVQSRSSKPSTVHSSGKRSPESCTASKAQRVSMPSTARIAVGGSGWVSSPATAASARSAYRAADDALAISRVSTGSPADRSALR